MSIYVKEDFDLRKKKGFLNDLMETNANDCFTLIWSLFMCKENLNYINSLRADKPLWMKVPGI